LFIQLAPDAIGNDYLAVGRVEKSAWKEGLKQQQSIDKLLPHANDFATYYEDLQLTRASYYQAGQKPPLAVPPPFQEWVKINPNQAGIKR
jgi:hypothetical protein